VELIRQSEWVYLFAKDKWRSCSGDAKSSILFADSGPLSWIRKSWRTLPAVVVRKSSGMLISARLCGSGGKAPRFCRRRVLLTCSRRPTFIRASGEIDKSSAAITCPGRAAVFRTAALIRHLAFVASTACVSASWLWAAVSCRSSN
jgi:hypothetical protein